MYCFWLLAVFYAALRLNLVLKVVKSTLAICSNIYNVLLVLFTVEHKTAVSFYFHGENY